MSRTKKQIESENEYLREQLVLTKNAFNYARDLIDEINNTLRAVDGKIRELEVAIGSKTGGEAISDSGRVVKEPTIKKSKSNRKRHPEHEMYKWVTPIGNNK
jgi:hypothetical protein